jgi:TrmH family RNA methyltransferase
VVEGIKHVGEAVEAWEAGLATHPVEFLCYAPEILSSEWARGLVREQIEKGTPCHAFSREAFESLAEKENPQGLLAVVRRRPLALEDLAPHNFPWGIALVQPQDPGNIGAILRTVDAVDASGLLLLDSSADPTHPSAVRASMGALFWRPVAEAPFAAFTRWASQHGYQVVGTSAHGSVDYRSVEQYQPPLVLLLGSERAGLSNEQAAACSQVIRLPMHGHVTSLNLAVAAGVMLYDVYDKWGGERKKK